MKTTIIAAKVGGRWIAFRDGADLAEFDPGKLSEWQFSGADCTTGSLIRVNDGIVDYGLARDAKGMPDAGAYASAYDVSFGVIHLSEVAGPCVQMTAPTRELVETLPPSILREYVYRADTSRSVTADELQSLRKPKASNTETESAEKKEPKA